MEFQNVLLESCQKIYDDLGYGLAELVYEKALKIELTSRGIKCENELYVNLHYTASDNEEYFLTSLRIDIIVYLNGRKIILELKTVKSELKEDDKEYYQAKRYERLLNADNSYLINFGKRLEVYNLGGEFRNLMNA